MNGDVLNEKLRRLFWYEIVFTEHTELRLFQRQIDKQIVIAHLRNPFCLKLAEKLFSEKDLEKYKLWFVPHKKTAYIYVIVINHSEHKIIVKTVIKQKLVWQKEAEKNAKKI